MSGSRRLPVREAVFPADRVRDGDWRVCGNETDSAHLLTHLVRRKAGAVLAMGVEKELKYKLNIPAGFLPVPGTSKHGDYGNELSAGGISVSR